MMLSGGSIAVDVRREPIASGMSKKGTILEWLSKDIRIDRKVDGDVPSTSATASAQGPASRCPTVHTRPDHEARHGEQTCTELRLLLASNKTES